MTDERDWRLARMTSPEAGERLAACDVALLPTGAVEQHGPHLTLDTDLYHAQRLCRDVSLACGEPYPVVLPGIPVGVSYHHDDFPGTLSVSAETLARYVTEIGRSAARQGVRKLVIVNGHGGNAPALQTAAQKIHRVTGIFVCVDTGETSDVDVAALVDTPGDIHAG
ncbi:MAG TPA: creatininase family protein, partial [Gemmatimonadota bacterium]|nr:creatininase family protein [Gemmatimonadota bacterium]